MKLRDSLAENHSIRLQAAADSWQEAVKSALTYWSPPMSSSRATTRPFWMGYNGSAPISLSLPASPCHTAARRKGSKTGFALVTLQTPLIFNHEDNDPVDILITLAAVDANTHQEVGIMQIVNLFADEANFDRLRACRTAREVLDLIDRTAAAAC